MFFSVLCAVALVLLWMGYRAVFLSNVNCKEEGALVFIPEKATVEEVAFILKHSNIIKNERRFLFVAELKKFQMPAKGGRYLIGKGWSNNDIINNLRIGGESPVRLTFNNIRTPEDLSLRLAQQLALDSSEIMACFHDRDFVYSLGFDFETIIAIFIPNTYEVYWSVDAKALFRRMKREYDAFWNENRIALCKELAYSPVEVITLASIIDEETNHFSEKATMAGVYINRLKRGIPLQADPTLRFAVNDFSIKRILNKHKKIDSPYNTYKHSGLPPGPIRIPSPKTIDAVLHYERHDYLYFCAKEDFSGEHHFAKTLKQHNAYARRYHRALNQRRIFK